MKDIQFRKSLLPTKFKIKGRLRSMNSRLVKLNEKLDSDLSFKNGQLLTDQTLELKNNIAFLEGLLIDLDNIIKNKL